MLRDWIAPVSVDEFMASSFRRAAWAQPGSAKSALAVLDWTALDRVLAATDPPPDVIVCARGKHLPYPPPRDLDELRAYMRMGIGLGMRHTQKCDPGLGDVARHFESLLPGEVQVQVFVTPGETHGFGWHYDAEDVFIAQTAGVKDYYFRKNTGQADAPFPPKDFSGFHQETSPLQTATLVPGDFLYIPARWWHMAICRETSLSISVGVMPGTRDGSQRGSSGSG
jgi:50S ribosomal protein L16 3-hydroxylase